MSPRQLRPIGTWWPAGLGPIALVASLAALTAIHGRAVLRPPVVAATVVLVGLALIELIDATGTLPVIRIEL
jgi:hypothetical protein